MHRRHFLESTALTALAASCHRQKQAGPITGGLQNIPSLAEGLELLKSGKLEARDWLAHCLSQISTRDSQGDALHAIIELKAHPYRLLENLPPGPLRGVPLLLKDNIETADGLMTTAGSLALVGAPQPKRDAFLARRLRAAGAVIFGKANLSEWANIRSPNSTSGWSARGGLTRNPHNPNHTASGSSSGSAAAVAAGFCAAAIGTETNGSIVSPASACGIVGLKPTLGSISRTGIIPITSWQDTAGPMTRTVRDAALLMDVIAAPDPEDPAGTRRPNRVPTSHLEFFSPEALKGRRLGVVRSLCGNHPGVLKHFEKTLAVLRAAGAEFVDHIELPNLRQAGTLAWRAMLTEFRQDLNNYLERRGGPVRSLAQLIAFNEQHRDEEMPYFGQEFFEEAERRGTAEAQAEATAARLDAAKLAGPEGLLAALKAHQLDALVCATNDPPGLIDLSRGDTSTRVASTPAAVAGYPHLTLPMGRVDGLPVGFSLIGAPWSEPLLLALGDALETRLGPIQ
ncbi:MAG: amidase [Prosthecobacter sp.]|nr:amidase [Prosthecobacter sp.]